MLLIAGLAVIWVLRYDSPQVAAAAAVGIAVALIGGEFAAFHIAGWLVDGIYPAIVVLLAFGAMLAGHLRATQAARRRLAELGSVEAAKTLVEQLEKYPANKDWLATIR